MKAGLFVLLCCSLAPLSLSAQTAVIGGRVFDIESGEGIPNARVTLEGHGSVLTTEIGSFLFQRVAPGDYTVRVEAFGYADVASSLTVTGDTDLPIPMAVEPFLLDTISVELETLDFDGRTRDPALDINVMDVEVLSDQGHEERSNTFGRFDLDDVYARVPLRVLIRGFGYLPLDTTFVPDDEERYNFGLHPDPIVQRMLNLQVDRMIERAGDNYYDYGAVLDRVGLTDFQRSATLQQIMEWSYPRHILRRVGCFFLDEREIRDRQERTHLLQSVVASEIERIELFEFPGIGRMFMARVYTRRYFQRHLGDDRPMKIPRMVAVPGGPICV